MGGLGVRGGLMSDVCDVFFYELVSEQLSFVG